MEYLIENEELSAAVKDDGAELISVRDKKTGRDYYAPGTETGLPLLLFPSIAMIKDDTMIVGGRKYNMPMGGFARMMRFSAENVSDTAITLSLRDDAGTAKYFPYAFLLKIKYELEGRALRVISTVENPSDTPLFFELGYHPAYRCRNAEEPHILRFEEPCTADRFVRPALLTTDVVPRFFEKKESVPLDESFFADGTIVLANADCRNVSVLGTKSGAGFSVDGSAFENICFYAPAGKPVEYVCIELWNSDPEYADTDQVWEHKKGIHALSPGGSYCAAWTFTAL